jgi:hypothetical protein
MGTSENSNKRLNSAYAASRAKAIARSGRRSPDPGSGSAKSLLPARRGPFFGHKRVFEFQMIV